MGKQYKDSAYVLVSDLSLNCYEGILQNISLFRRLIIPAFVRSFVFNTFRKVSYYYLRSYVKYLIIIIIADCIDYNISFSCYFSRWRLVISMIIRMSYDNPLSMYIPAPAGIPFFLLFFLWRTLYEYSIWDVSHTGNQSQPHKQHYRMRAYKCTIL